MTHIFRIVGGAACLTLLACQKEKPAPVSLDARTPVALPPEALQAVHVEMRTMLNSVNELHQALATRDTALARRAAVASGLAAAEDPALAPLLPAAFLQLAVATHSAFDSVALAIHPRVPVDTMMMRLSHITANCVACHATYRLVPAAPPSR